MLIRFTKKFNKQYNRTDSKIKSAFKKRLNLFFKNPLNPQLNNHQLYGKLNSFRSINITGDWRAIYSEARNQKGETIIIFEVFGTHSQLYR